MINITKEEMEEFSRIEKIITDTKEMYLFFSNSTEDEIISLCWNDMIMSEKSYMKLFEMACYSNKPKVVQNFLTKEYTSEENNDHLLLLYINHQYVLPQNLYLGFPY